MRESKGALGSDLAKLDDTTDEEIARQIAEDPDTAPELTDEWFDKAERRVGDKVIRRGRPPLTPTAKMKKAIKSPVGSRHSFSAGETRAVVGRTGWYADGKPALEIHASKLKADSLPIRENGPAKIDLKIGNRIWRAKLRITEDCPYVWISPTLIDSNGQRCRLVDALANFQPNDRVILRTKGRKVEVIREDDE